MRPGAADIAVLPFEPRHARAFRDLNIAWLERYFAVEEKDHELLGDPEGRIIAKGGAILIAEEGHGTVIGCVALVPIGDDVLELAKMAVAEDIQGKGVGRLLMDAAVARARALGASAIYLESNSRLGPALHLYEQAGFRHLPAEERPRSPYVRCDVYMRLQLRN